MCYSVRGLRRKFQVSNFPKDRRDGVLDSGASHHMSGCRDDFAAITDESVWIKVADRRLPKPARIGIFRQNTLGMKVGLFHPELTQLLVSVTQLEEDGKVTIFDKKNRRIEFGKEKWKIEKMDDLPMVSVVFGANQSGTSGKKTNRSDGVAQAAQALTTKAEKEALRQHERHGHFYMPGVKVNCPSCQISKGRRGSHRDERPEIHKPKESLEQVDWDFVGKFPESMTGNIWNLNAYDSWSGWAESYPMKRKHKNHEALDRFCAEMGKNPDRIRADNAKEFKEDNCKWRAVCVRRGIKLTFSPPYTPQLNGAVERFNQTSTNAIRTNLVGVDKRVWDYAAKYVAYVWNRVGKGKKKPTPFKKRFGREASTKHLRRFGCLCYALEHKKRAKLEDKYERGIFLGYGTENSTYLIGVWRPDDRTKAGVSFQVLENADCKFDESVLISDVEDLKKFQTGTFVPYALPGQLGDHGDQQVPIVVAEESSTPSDRARRSGPQGSSSAGEKAGDTRTTEVRRDVNSLLQPKTQESPDPEPRRKRRKIDWSEKLEKLNSGSVRQPAAEDGSSTTDGTQGVVSGRQPNQAVDDRVVVGTDGVVRKKRGRRPGTRAKPHWKKPGPKRTDESKPESRKKKKKVSTATAAATLAMMAEFLDPKPHRKSWGRRYRRPAQRSIDGC